MKNLWPYLMIMLISLTANASFESIKMEEKRFFLVDGATPHQNSATKFIVDTGASDTVLLDWYTVKSKIPVQDSLEKATDSGGISFQAKEAQVSDIKFGPFHQKFKRLYVVPSPGPFEQFGVGGILSPQTLFEGQEFFLDFPNRKLSSGDKIAQSLKDRKLVTTLSIEPCDKENGNKYVISASFNGVRGRFYLDSGGRNAALASNYSVKLGFLKGEGGERIGVGSKREIKKVKNLKFATTNLDSNLDVDIEPNGVSCPSADGKIGIDFMRNYSWLFSSDRTKVRLYQ